MRIRIWIPSITFKSPPWWSMSVILSLGRSRGQKHPWSLLASQANWMHELFAYWETLVSKKLNEEELKKTPDVKLWSLHAHPCASSPTPATHTNKNKTFLKKYNIEESFNVSSMVLTLYVVNVKLLENGLKGCPLGGGEETKIFNKWINKKINKKKDAHYDKLW